MSDAGTPRKKSFGFGVVRIGLFIERHGRLAWGIAALVTAVTIYGLFHVSVDRDLRDMFRGETALYQTYVATTEAFVDPENQVIVLVEGEGIRTPEGLRALEDLQLELQLLDDAGNVFSMFSLRTAPDGAGATLPVIDGDGGLDDATIAAIREHPLQGESLVSADGTAMIFVVTHVEPKATLEQHTALIAEIDGAVDSALAGTGLTVTVTGFAALRTEIVRLLKRDQLVLNGSGAIVGLLLSLVLFRSFIGALITALPAALGALTLIGWNGAFGVPVTILSNVVPALIMVIGYADGMHITSAFRRFRSQGLSVAKAERHALAEVGPACILSALTTVVAFLSMFFSDVRILRDFAIIGSIGTLLGAWVVILGHLMVTRALGKYWKVGAGVPASPLEIAAKPVAAIARWVIPRAWPISILAVPLTLGLGILFLLVPPEHSVRETLPANSASTIALQTIDDDLGGAFPIQIVVPLDGVAPASAAGLARIEAVHQAVAAVPGIASPPLSLWSFADWLGDGTEPLPERVAAVLDQLPEDALRRFVGPPGALVTVNVREASTTETSLLIDRIEAAVHAVAPDALVTGSTVVNTREATRTILNLSTGFGSAIVIALILMAIALRSVGVGIVAAIPNVLPIAATGTLLFFLGTGMQITSVVSLTVAFGIAVDDTIHYLNLVLRQRGDLNRRLIGAAHDIGPVLIGTSLVIVVGLSMTLTSGLASVQQFGLLAMVTLVVAMAGDLIISPALIAGPFRRLFERGKRGGTGAGAGE
ncbi:MAG: MMPL family transporter [Bauldia sp.]|nr:MMPL family transporter [Bauldia sp.]